uniref:Uncharacterized protein n=1 Tax=Oryza brachyantha TaxID=4533 RepID=J3MDW2_ORYBR
MTTYLGPYNFLLNLKAYHTHTTLPYAVGFRNINARLTTIFCGSILIHGKTNAKAKNHAEEELQVRTWLECAMATLSSSMFLRNSPNATHDEPPSFHAAAALSFAAMTFSRTPCRSSGSMIRLTVASMMSARTSTPGLYPLTSMPTFISSTMNTLFIHCSASSGQHTIGTPAATASSVEFHPQCVLNAPVDACCSTATCGAQDAVTTNTLSAVRAKNPSGRRASAASGSVALAPAGARSTHKNLCPDLSIAVAISLTCSGESAPRLPKQRNTTLRSGCASSHARHWCLSSSASPLAISGPTQ